GDEDTSRALVTGTLRRDDGGLRRLLCSLAEVHVRGVDVDWTVLLPEARRVDLPTYAFNRQRYWLEELPAPAAGTPADQADAALWAAIERGDTDEVARELALDDHCKRASLDEVLPALSDWNRRRREQALLDSWRYRVTWTPVADPPPPAALGHWAIVSPENAAPVATVLTDALTASGARITLLTIDPLDLDRATLARRLDDAADANAPFDGVLSLLALAPGHHPGLPALPTGLAATLALVQAAEDLRLTAPLWCATQGAVSTGPGPSRTDPVQAAVWGLGRVAALEHPGRWGGLVDLPDDPGDTALRRMAAVLAGTTTEDQVAIRESGLLARRLVPAPTRDTAQRRWHPRGTVLVTGGTGGVAAHVARWLAANGAEHLVLASRRGPEAEGAADLAEELAALGVDVTFAACDVADRDSVARLLAQLPDRHPLTAVVHAAGVAWPEALATTGPTEVADVLAAKASGAAHLDELLGDIDLDAFVLFSSNAAVWGSATQGAYAAANAFLDALAEQRRARGLTATSVAWGAWDGGGMSTFSADVRSGLQRSGLTLMAPEAAVRALVHAVGHGETCVTVTDVDWSRFAPRFTAMRPSPLLDNIPEVRRIREESAPAPAAESEGAGRELAARLAGLSPADRQRTLLDLVRTEAATVLGHSGTAAVPPDRAFGELGFDSLTAVELRNRLISACGVPLPTTVVFDHPNPAAVADLLRTLLAPAADGRPPVLAELAALETALAGATPDAPLRAQITARLRSLAARWDGETPGDDLDLDLATDDQVFQLIDSEFGQA
ncbi:SDR family NAD(P)-dependent oxidoreductase, partial [Nocardiopsis ansamitocini]|uniref:SDR family NAD(P)-dependent oxidoreductase n=1 Tax=Nocardiopsis ansamitocini TaxID=1670832 RepID=UPI0025558C04